MPDVPRSDRTIPALFERRVEEAPDAVALSCGPVSMTYAALNARANGLARAFAALGAGLERRVVVCVGRSVERIAVVLGALKAGAAYVGVERAWPATYVRSVTDNVAPAFVVASAALADRFSGLRWPVHSLEQLWQRTPPDPCNVGVPASPENLAYIVYTSGSTGTPKGIAMPHRGVVHLAAERTHIEQSSREVMMQVAPLSFDLSAFEIWCTLLNGGRLEVFPDDRDFTALAAAADQGGVTSVLLTAGLFHALVDSTPALFGRGRQAIAGGDVVSSPHVRRALSAGARRFVVGYGPAESSTFATYAAFTCADDLPDPLPIGKAMDGAAAYVRDAAGADAGTGAGELWMAGDGLARGYFNAPALTAERFLPDPSAATPGARMYRTGDRGRRVGGVIEFLGRMDAQVKIRGFRVEVNAVAALLRRAPDVQDAAVTVEGTAAEDKRLVGWVVPRHTAASEHAIRQWMAGHVPEYSVPAELVLIERLPLTVNGKVDRAALASLRQQRRDPMRVGPRDEIESSIVLLCERAIGRAPVSVRDEFFALGGRSIQAVSFVAAIERRHGVKIPLSAVAEASSLEEIAQRVRRGAVREERRLVLLRDGGDAAPLFWMHPAGGSVFVYFELCRLLGADRRHYGLQCLEFDGAAAVAAATIPELARTYVADMRRTWPDGPYLIAGWSMGGILAYEAACQLRQAGADVALVAVVDAGPAHVVHAVDPRVDDADVLLVQAHQVEPGILRELAGLQGDARLDRALAIARAHHVVPPDVTREQLQRRLRLYRRNTTAQAQFRPHPYDGAVDLFRAADGLTSDLPLTLGWEAVVRGSLRVHMVSGAHQSLPYAPHVQALAHAVATSVAAVEQAHAAR